MSRNGAYSRTSAFVQAAAIVAAIVVVLPATALAHVERTSYWPDPAPDRGVEPAAGGEVPEYRKLRTALRTRAPGQTRIVCQDDSLKSAKHSIRTARGGFKLRPSEELRTLSRRRAHKLRRLNRRFMRRCRYDSIQEAVVDSANNDRIVIMPGTYTEPASRAAPENDPACADLVSDSDHGTGAVSYRYQAACPNDQNLIAIIGREALDAPDPQVGPDTDRHGIPNVGPCIRCNLQIEGSGARPQDVVIDAGNGPSAAGPQAGEGKDVGIRADRADGFYLRNLTVQHAEEHGVYPIEVDGYAIDRVRMLYNHEYGHLSFTSDHGLVTNCDAAGSGDAGVYPGAAAQTGEQTVESKRRYNQEIRNCDLHHNTLGHSGSMGDAIHIHDNDVYDNAVGLSVDSISTAGHPGYPQDSLLVEDNRIYSNNLNPFEEGSDFAPTVPAAVGTGMWIAGGNANVLRDNRIYDNWRRGVMLFQVPDAIACAPSGPQQTCSPTQYPTQSNAHRNRFHDNVMGISPEGRRQPNGVDFWWAEQLGDSDNCWYGNLGAAGTQGSVTGDPDPLPSQCDNGPSVGSPTKLAELLTCFLATEGGELDPPGCPWYDTPRRP
jgi:hypothetical protein